MSSTLGGRGHFVKIMAMTKEICAGAIIFKKEAGNVSYLLLHYPAPKHRAQKSYWGFAKGHIEDGEDELLAVKREIFEETSIDQLRLLGGFREVLNYEFPFEGKMIPKEVIFYLAQVDDGQVRLSQEHDGYVWLNYEEARAALSFDNAKEILQKAEASLSQSNQ